MNVGTFKECSEIDIDDSFQVCAFSEDYDGLYECKTAINTEASPEVVWIQASSGIGRVPEGSPVYNPKVYDGPSYYDEDGNVIPNSYVKQGDDSTNTDKDHGSGIGVSFGDNSDHNTVNIDQRSTFADVIRDLVPIAKEGAHMAKDTAPQLLN